MEHVQTRPADRYSPLYFLASLGAGGLAVTFFMYLMFWVPHPGQPVPVFEDIARTFATGGMPIQAAIAIATVAIAALAFTNIRLLIWNIGAYRRFARTEAFAALTSGNADTQRLALPLALAMSINVGFILGLVFVPGLWQVVEYLFPLALTAFGMVGAMALGLAGQFLRRVLSAPGGFDMEANNSFAQMMPAFAFAMIAVGFSAPAAMSGIPATVAIGLVGSVFFATASVLWAVAAGLKGFEAMLKHGIAHEAAPTLMVVIPLMTVLGIMMVRQAHGLHTTFAAHGDQVDTLMLLTKLLSVQVIFGLIGVMILRAQGYAGRFLFGGTPSAGAYALVCPGVALSVMLHFWINKGLVANGLIEKFGAGYWGLTALALILQFAMLALAIHLNRQHFGWHTAAPVPAE